MKLAHLFDSLRADIATVAAHYGVDPFEAEGGKTGLKTMYGLLNVVSNQRAYDDSHPGFVQGVWPRILPFDGRDACWYYENGCDDTHVATLLRKIKSSFAK